MLAAQTWQEWEWDDLVRARVRELAYKLHVSGMPMRVLRNMALAQARQELLAEKVIPERYRTELFAVT